MYSYHGQQNPPILASLIAFPNTAAKDLLRLRINGNVIDSCCHLCLITKTPARTPV